MCTKLGAQLCVRARALNIKTTSTKGDKMMKKNNMFAMHRAFICDESKRKRERESESAIVKLHLTFVIVAILY